MFNLEAIFPGLHFVNKLLLNSFKTQFKLNGLSNVKNNPVDRVKQKKKQQKIVVYFDHWVTSIIISKLLDILLMLVDAFNAQDNRQIITGCDLSKDKNVLTKSSQDILTKLELTE